MAENDEYYGSEKARDAYHGLYEAYLDTGLTESQIEDVLCLEIPDNEYFNRESIETEIFWIGNKPIGGCIACMECRETGECVFNDVVNRFREKACEADGFIFGSPVHYAAASGNMAYLLKCQEAARKAGIPLPEREEPIFTNFIR